MNFHIKPTIVILIMYGIKNILLNTLTPTIFFVRATAIASANTLARIMNRIVYLAVNPRLVRKPEELSNTVI